MRGLAPRIWTGETRGAQAARLALAPAALAYGFAVRARRSAYAGGWLPARSLPLPSVGVGNLAVGGAGKTPVAGWIARWLRSEGVTPGILLRGYGADEGTVHREAVPGAVVVEDADRYRAACAARSRGAEVLVLDDAFQRLDVRRDADLVLVAAESGPHSRRLLPAGPWRERWDTLRHADVVVVTRKAASEHAAAGLADAVARAAPGRPVAMAHLRLTGFTGMRSGARLPTGALRGAQVLAMAGIADPTSFAAQLTALGARVTLAARPDHHGWRAAEARALLHAHAKVDYVVVTAKDAAKLDSAWPAGAADPIVAELDIAWERGGTLVTAILARLVSAARAVTWSHT
jgi:tetraacyldisaccharide 4'-kinase